MHFRNVIGILSVLGFYLIGNCRAASDPTSYREPNDHHVDDSFSAIDITNFPLGNAEVQVGSVHEIPGEPLNPTDFANALKVSIELPSRDKLGGDPIEIAGLFEGDISGPRPPNVTGIKKTVLAKNAIKDMSLRWDGGQIPYVISASFPQYERSVIARAMIEYHNKTCIRFVPRTNHRDYVHLIPGSGCSSNVGRTGGAQPVSLGAGCVYVGIVIHELMHAAGFWHEQSREDRDKYITINWNNIIQGMEYNFQKYALDRIQYLGSKYDTGSVMHYDAFAFAKNRDRPTIIANQEKGEIGQRRGFSDVDVFKLNRLYECNGGSTTSTSTTTMPPLVSTEAPGKCEDSNQYCQIWSSFGECTKNTAWMHVNCRKSCKQCGVDCTDYNIYCDRWAATGECSKNNAYMQIYCPKACKYCSLASNPNACEDRNRYCTSWADRKQCEANPEYMNSMCKKSCKKC